MNYLGRDDASFGEELWQQIDAAVVDSAKGALVARRFLPLYGPLGYGADTVSIDSTSREEVLEDGLVVMEGRSLAQLPALYEDFWLYGRDLAANDRTATPVDLGAARTAAQNLARREDRMVFYGIDKLGIKGLVNTPGVKTQKRGDWSKGEGAFSDIAAAIGTLLDNARYGRHTLVVSTDLYVQLQRIQPGTGLLESERAAKLLDGRLFHATTLEKGTALLVCAQPQYMDLALGQDIAAAYVEYAELNHHFRVMETVLPRVKAPDAVVVIK